MKYICYANLEIEIEAESKELAQAEASKKFEELEKTGVKITEAKFADKNTGYWI